MFRLAPKFDTTKTFSPDGHLTVESTCTIVDQEGTPWGQASAICTTRESRYAYRRAERVCPKCGKAAIIKGKAEFGGGWLCWKKKDGCGQQFKDDAPEIVTQTVGRIANEDLADLYNTVLRICEKRSYLAAIRLATGCSGLFDEERPEAEKAEHSPAPEQPAAQAETPEQAAKRSVSEQWARHLCAKFAAAKSEADVAATVAEIKKVAGELLPEDMETVKQAFRKTPKFPAATAPSEVEIAVNGVLHSITHEQRNALLAQVHACGGWSKEVERWFGIPMLDNLPSRLFELTQKLLHLQAENGAEIGDFLAHMKVASLAALPDNRIGEAMTAVNEVLKTKAELEQERKRPRQKAMA